jgi:hypothetical protein
MLTESWLRLKISVERRARRSTCGLLDESENGTVKKSKISITDWLKRMNDETDEKGWARRVRERKECGWKRHPRGFKPFDRFPSQP